MASSLLPPFAIMPAVAFALTAAAVAPADFGGLPRDYSYVELADMATGAPMVVGATIRRALVLKGADVAGVPAGKTRYLIDAGVTGLIAGQALPPAEIHYLVDLPAELHKPRLKGVEVLLLARPGGRPGEITLIGPRAQVPRTPRNEQRLRAILTDLVARDAPPALVGVGHAFHVAGTLPGEGETQIFLRTADSRPISLSILRRPGEQPRWAVALSELVDASAKPPLPDTLLWYRLACGLPSALPTDSLDGVQPADADQARTDYRFVLDALGPCRHG